MTTIHDAFEATKLERWINQLSALRADMAVDPSVMAAFAANQRNRECPTANANDHLWFAIGSIEDALTVMGQLLQLESIQEGSFERDGDRQSPRIEGPAR